MRTKSTGNIKKTTARYIIIKLFKVAIKRSLKSSQRKRGTLCIGKQIVQQSFVGIVNLKMKDQPWLV